MALSTTQDPLESLESLELPPTDFHIGSTHSVCEFMVEEMAEHFDLRVSGRAKQIHPLALFFFSHGSPDIRMCRHFAVSVRLDIRRIGVFVNL
jgi:hypothetical protein